MVSKGCEPSHLYLDQPYNSGTKTNHVPINHLLTILACPRNLGSIIRKWVISYTYQWGYIGGISHLLTIYQVPVGHPSSILQSVWPPRYTHRSPPVAPSAVFADFEAQPSGEARWRPWRQRSTPKWKTVWGGVKQKFDVLYVLYTSLYEMLNVCSI